MNRKSNLDALFGRRADPKASQDSAGFAPANSETADEFAGANSHSALPVGRRKSGAIGAMSTTLRGLAAQADAAAAIEAGSVVIELNPAQIDPSFIADRVNDATDPSLSALVESIRESGQEVPILVRPHPTVAGRYQIAYGRRRTRAAAILLRPVRAVVRPLTDAELVVAQGKENLERRDLSFIERAFFALRLEEHAFPRETIMAAMGVAKGDLSTLISVARTVPEDILAAIGPAPSAGRPRWMLLAERIKAGKARSLDVLLADPEFQAKETDARFAAVLTAVAPKAPFKPKAQTWRDVAGRKLARVERSKDRVAMSFDETVEPGFGDYVLDRLPEILAAYQASKG